MLVSEAREEKNSQNGKEDFQAGQQAKLNREQIQSIQSGMDPVELPLIDRIILQLKKDESIELETEDSMLTIRHRKFFGTDKEFNFELNAKAVFGCKTDKAAKRKIEEFIAKRFKLTEE